MCSVATSYNSKQTLHKTIRFWVFKLRYRYGLSSAHGCNHPVKLYYSKMATCLQQKSHELAMLWRCYCKKNHYIDILVDWYNYYHVETFSSDDANLSKNMFSTNTRCLPRSKYYLVRYIYAHDSSTIKRWFILHSLVKKLQEIVEEARLGGHPQKVSWWFVVVKDYAALLTYTQLQWRSTGKRGNVSGAPALVVLPVHRMP